MIMIPVQNSINSTAVPETEVQAQRVSVTAVYIAAVIWLSYPRMVSYIYICTRYGM